ncbi:MAG: helix-turn-helix domain-containing protein [Pseudonocardia sp.]
MQDDRTRMLRVKAVAEMFDVSAATIYRAIRSGQLDALRIGGSVRVPSDALKVFGEPAFTTPLGRTAASAEQAEVTR